MIYKKAFINQLNVVYIAYEGFLDWPVFDTQVVEPFKEISKRSDLLITLFAFERLDRFLKNLPRVIKKRNLIKAETNSQVIFLPRLAGTAGLVFSRLLLTIWLISRKQPLVLHCRGMKGTQVGRLLKRLRPSTRIIFDVRGAEPEEFTYNQSKDVLTEQACLGSAQKKLRWLNNLERHAAKAADHFFCVSEQMKTHMQKKYRVPEEKIDVIPCGVKNSFMYDQNVRELSRRRLGLSDKSVFVYVGSMDVGQLPRFTFRLFKQFKSIMPEAFLLVLTYDLEQAYDLLKAESIPKNSMLVDNIPNNMVPEMLCAADFGMLLREKSVRNSVSAPVKFSEYMSCGLPVITTDAIPGACLELRGMDIGLILPSESVVNQIDSAKISQDITVAKLSNSERKDISRLMTDRYWWSNLVNKYIVRYFDLLK